MTSHPAARLLALRRSPVLLKLPPYLSALCILIGVAWLFILPLDEYSRQTYVSENAILPGQVHTYFGGSEHNIFRAYRQEVYLLSQRSNDELLEGLAQMMQESGLKIAKQAYHYTVSGEEMAGTNVYGLLQGPRADATEAMVLMAAWKNFDGEINYSGVALALTLARYFKRWSIWSKDIILLIPADSTYGPEAWVSAYHSTATDITSSRNVSALPIKVGALQAVVALDYPVGPWGRRFDKLDILYDGINGALPNLDLLNTAVSVASGQMGIGCSLHGLSSHDDSYQDRLTTLARGVITQSAGHATGPHSAFMPYHVDAITLKTVGDGWHDEMSLGRVTESLFRSINNLLEHLHQSFFFYILLNANRFVSIGNYLPAAMLIAGSFTITALALWVQSGRVPAKGTAKPALSTEKGKGPEMELVKSGNDVALIPKPATDSAERKMFLPAIAVLGVHLASLLPLYVLNHFPQTYLPYALHATTATTFALPVLLGYLLTRTFSASRQQLQIAQSFSLLLLGATLSTLATLNFSLAFVVGVLASPLNFVRPQQGNHVLVKALNYGMAIGLNVVAPPIVLYALVWYTGKGEQWVLGKMAKGWCAQGGWTSLVIWGVWWPAGVLGGSVLWGEVFRLDS